MLWFWAAMAFLFGMLFGALMAAVLLLEDRELKWKEENEDEDIRGGR